IVFMEVPDHASVDTSVRLVEMAGMEGQKGFANAVLRNITRTYKELVPRQDEARINTPEWLLKIWIKDYDLRLAA
ncbi:MAG TPA: MFS transporter, partial [Rhodospirillaceae bacterium]|nr:MFS transporter [Rhodospirillaceae bacterium]